MNRKKSNKCIHKEYELKSETDQNRFVIDNWYVWSSNDVYSKVFKKPLKNHGRMPWNRKVVKIFSEKTNRSVFRIWRGVPAYVTSKNILFLDREAKNLLKFSDEGGKSDEKSIPIVLTPSTKHSFYWQHFSPEVRTAYKLGLISLSLGIISVIISILSWII